MWDGREYESRDAARAAAEGYSADGFEAEIVGEAAAEGQEERGEVYLVYTRRVAQAGTGDAEAAG